MYDALGHGDFRVLVLAPDKQQDAAISVQLVQCKLNNAPVYDALSYVWGDSNHKLTIACESQPFDVTANLHWALKRARHSYEPRNLWVDAVCINQQNLNERSHQVSIMGKIFSGARKVFICMGEPPHSGQDEDVASLVNGASLLWGPHNFSMMLSNSDPLRLDRRWESLAELMQRPWFKRTWVIQEAGLALDPHVLYGKSDFGYRSMFKLIDSWNAQSPSFLLPSLAIHREWCDWQLGDHYTRRHPRTFLDLLNHGALLECGDPRDYVYAFLGHPLSMDPRTGNPLVVPDYNKPVNQVFHEVSRSFLQHFGLRLLSSIEHTIFTITRDDLPSWVVRWDICLVYEDISELHYSLYRATPATWAPTTSPLAQGDRLMLPGVLLDTVQRSWVVYNGSGPGEFVHLDFESSTGAHVRGQLDRCMPGIWVDFDTLPDTGFAYAIKRFHYNRRIFQTFRGILGIGPFITRPGDVVALIFGSDVPFILRPDTRSSNYRLVGNTYVDCFMHGEIEAMLLRREVTEETICII